MLLCSYSLFHDPISGIFITEDEIISSEIAVQEALGDLMKPSEQKMKTRYRKFIQKIDYVSESIGNYIHSLVENINYDEIMDHIESKYVE